MPYIKTQTKVKTMTTEIKTGGDNMKAPISLSDSIRVVQHTIIGRGGGEGDTPAGYEIQALDANGDWVPITEVEVRHEPRMVIVDAPTKPRSDDQ